MQPRNEGEDAEKKKREEATFIGNVFLCGVGIGFIIAMFLFYSLKDAHKSSIVDMPTNSSVPAADKLGVNPMEIVSVVFSIFSTIGSWLGVILAVLIYHKMPRYLPAVRH